MLWEIRDLASVAWAGASACRSWLWVAVLRGAATTQHSFGGSFSAGSTPIFASKHAFFSIFQNLQENHLLASKFCKFLQKFAKKLTLVCKFCKILQFFAIFSEIRKNVAKICRIVCRILQKFVDFEKRWKMLYWMQKFMQILLKFDEILTNFDQMC